MRALWIIPLFSSLFMPLAGCDSPSPRMMGGERQEVVVAGSAFTVYRVGDAVEIYRTSPEFMPRLGEVVAKAGEAVRRATGCPVKDGSMVGDAALLRATLDCG